MDLVAVGFLHPGHYAACFAESMSTLLFHDATGNQRIVSHPHGQMGKECGSNGIVAGRNQLARVVVDESEAEWLFMIDSDMGFAPDTVEQLIASADPVERPVVGALAFAHKADGRSDFYGIRYRACPTVYDGMMETPDGHMGFHAVLDYPRNQIMAVAATGAACILIHRNALVAVRDKFGGDVWFDPFTHPKGPTTFSEDLSFSIRCAIANVPLHVDTSVKTTHDKGGVFLDEAYYDRQQIALGETTVPPATELVDVIVPVLHRPANVGPLMESLRASTGLATAWFVCEPDDITEWAEVDKHGGSRLVCPGTFAEKVNYAYNNTRAPWLMLVGDDVRFRPAWLDHALHAARNGANVIGTNDLGNPAVVAGEHAVHMLIRRTYIDDVGSSWDGPGVVCHEGYRHAYIDDEVITVAKQRATFTPALLSIVEHIHPAWGKAPDDDIYELGRQHATDDEATFNRRLARSQVGVDA